MIPKDLNTSTNGTIEQRQTTFVKIRVSHGHEYKISYQNKREHRIEQGPFKGIYLDPKHPLLRHYRDDFLKIHISSKLSDTFELVRELKELLKFEYNGWRGFDEYFNSGYDIGKLVSEGFGLLYDGPSELGFKISSVLKRYNISHNFKTYSNYRKPNMKALLLGNNIVVAEGFKFEKLKP